MNRTLLIESLNHFLCNDLSEYILYFIEPGLLPGLLPGFITQHPGCYGLGYLIEFDNSKDFKDVCGNGYINLVNWMIKEGFPGTTRDWNIGLACACKNGYKDLLDCMIKRGANDFDWGWALACNHRQYDLVGLMMRLRDSRLDPLNP